MSNETDRATPRPWKTLLCQGGWYVVDADNRFVAAMTDGTGQIGATDEARAALIVPGRPGPGPRGDEMNYYEIYPGGEITGEIVIETEIAADADGLVVMSEAEYDRSFSRVDRRRRMSMNYHEHYDVTTSNGVAVLHPRGIPLDDPRVSAALALALARGN